MHPEVVAIATGMFDIETSLFEYSFTQNIQLMGIVYIYVCLLIKILKSIDLTETIFSWSLDR